MERVASLSAQAAIPTYNQLTPLFPSVSHLIKEVVVDQLDRIWVADITYIRLPTAFVYLATIPDAYSRRCVGWELSRSANADLTLTALENAVQTRCPKPGLIHHSDQGVQYASIDYTLRLEQLGAQISMATVGNPYENVLAECFFRTLKHEEVQLKRYQNYDEARANITEFIDDVLQHKASSLLPGLPSPPPSLRSVVINLSTKTDFCHWSGEMGALQLSTFHVGEMLFPIRHRPPEGLGYLLALVRRRPLRRRGSCSPVTVRPAPVREKPWTDKGADFETLDAEV